MKLLKEPCEDHLSTTLSIESAVPLLLSADLHSADKLKENCLEFITGNAEKVMHTKSWEEMAYTRPDLMVQTCQQLPLVRERQITRFASLADCKHTTCQCGGKFNSYFL